ncbi:hypothetical protein AAVH_03691 [Aphelenchoides avenae]|nr:hypothetical protein AAVH_03691 [Aphelenchus avenae]
MASTSQLNFEVTFLNEKLKGHATVLQNCLFLWLGSGRTDILSFGFNDRSILLSGQPLPSDAMLVQTINLKLNKLFLGRQVFFSTDISVEQMEPKHCQELFGILKQHIDENAEFYKLSTKQ